MAEVSAEIIEAFAAKNERLRSAMSDLLDVLNLSVPKVFPDLQSWANAHKDDKHHLNGREARAILAAYGALANGTLKAGGDD